MYPLMPNKNVPRGTYRKFGKLLSGLFSVDMTKGSMPSDADCPEYFQRKIL
jgi:hypothetical protein